MDLLYTFATHDCCLHLQGWSLSPGLCFMYGPVKSNSHIYRTVIYNPFSTILPPTLFLMRTLPSGSSNWNYASFLVYAYCLIPDDFIRKKCETTTKLISFSYPMLTILLSNMQLNQVSRLFLTSISVSHIPLAEVQTEITVTNFHENLWASWVA